MDPNLLLYAEDGLSEHHGAARAWRDAQLSGSEMVGWCRPVLTAFMRIGTNSRLHRRPLTPKEAIERVQSWLDQPCVRMVEPTDQHGPILQRMLRQGNATANLVPDAHLAALAVQQNLTLHSTDMDFAPFPGLKWRNPLARDWAQTSCPCVTVATPSMWTMFML